MKEYIKKRLREGVNMPSFNLPEELEPTPEEFQLLKTLTWRDIMVEPKENDGSAMFYLDVLFRNSELNKFSPSIVFSIQQINEIYYHPHLFIANKLQGIGIGPKLLKAFIMDFGHIYTTKARTLNQNASKMIQGFSNDPDVDFNSNGDITLVIKIDNPDKEELLQIFNR